MKEIFIEEKLIVYLMMLKITPNLKGYTYMKETVKRLCMHEEKKMHMTTGIYREVAEYFHEKPSLFDRALRHAVEVSYKKNGIEDFERATKFEFPIPKPTARDVICMLAEKVAIDLSKTSYI